MEIPYQKDRQQYPYRVTQKLRAAFSLGDQPTEVLQKWQGYFRNTDPTILPANCLTFPSINCFIPNKDKIVPRLGTTLLGQAYTPTFDWPIIGHKKRFATMGGIEVEVRVEKTNDANLKDIVSVLYPSPATGDLTWYHLTENINPLTAGTHRYYMDDWYDTNLNPAKSLNLPRLIWVCGLTNAFSWTGGIAPVVSFIPNTSITTTTGISWASLGFVDPTIDPTSSGNIIINGVKYIITGGWATDTLLTASTAGISVNDLATSEIQVDISPTAPTVILDVCRSNKDYIFYGNWNSRRLYQSNGYEADAIVEITSFSGGLLNDLIIPPTSTYTGTGSHIYHIVIDSINPPINSEVQSFVGTTGSNGSYFNTTGYSGGTGNNKYRVSIIADSVMTLVAGAGVFLDGEGLVCVNGGVTTATLKVIADGALTGGALATQTISGTPSPGDTVIGTNSGTSRTILAFTYFNSAQLFKSLNGGSFTQVTGLAGMSNFGAVLGVIQFYTVDAFLTPFDGLVFRNPTIGGNTSGDYYELDIQHNPGGPDTFKWWIDSAAPTTGVAITTGVQTLSQGVEIQFGSDMGHSVGDAWTIQVNQAIDKAWVNFYFTSPVRKPYEGYIYTLPSNFWTMAPQESEMYVNTKFGQWGYVETVLSADLQSESVSFKPLKQVSSSKVIFPYMIGYMDDDLIYVTENKTLDMIGRKELLQLPQTTNLSQAVALDFEEATFEDGSMEYLGKKLFITSPRESLMLVYDNQPDNKYWQPPQVIPENGILSIIGNTLISHSNIRNQTLNLFTGTSGDLESNYTVRARSAYFCYGNRWSWKQSNKSFVEGYVSAAPPMTQRVYLDIGGCHGIFEHLIKPVVCVLPDEAPFGEGNFGSHQNGSDIFNNDSHFYEIYPDYKPIMEYRFAALELECIATNHSYSWLSMGLNEVIGNRGNTDLLNKKVISMQ